ncbi:MAG: hypothetical protein IE880_04560 [Epsilonproteobacteria bacterium]|nr:hypothetical protein [Campylobacterota bacterium]
MKIDDILFELESNYINENDIDTIKDYIEENGIKLAHIDAMLEEMGYDALFDDYETAPSSSSSAIQKITHKKHLTD